MENRVIELSWELLKSVPNAPLTTGGSQTQQAQNAGLQKKKPLEGGKNLPFSNLKFLE